MENKDISRSSLWWKIGLVILLVLIVTVVILIKRGVFQSSLAPTVVLNQSVTNRTNPLDHAFKTGRVVVADFGRGTCIPCKMMKPILEELAVTYKGKAEILILDISEYPDLVQKYEINLIPTQIFFDKSGKDVWFHEGFLEKDKIIEQLKELGVE
jgi:thioredoxin 1